jgi:hypothetical protein
MAAFYSRFPALRGILILEDLPEVIDFIKELDTSIEQVKHDFLFHNPTLRGPRKLIF